MKCQIPFSRKNMNKNINNKSNTVPLFSCANLHGSSMYTSSDIVGLSSSSEALNIPMTSFIASLVLTVGEGAPLHVWDQNNIRPN